MRLRPSWGRAVRGRARQPPRVRRSVPISPLSPPTTAKEATMDGLARAKAEFERGVRRHRSKDGT